VGDFRDLEVWRMAHELALVAYQITEGLPADERYGLRDQVLLGVTGSGKTFSVANLIERVQRTLGEALDGEMLTNYLQAQDVIGKTIAWTAINLVFHFTLGLGAALLLNRKMPGRNIYRALLILPWAMPQYISALTWRGMFNVEYGAVNLMLGKVGIEAVPWFTSEFWAFMAPVITNIWLGFPFIMVIALGGLQSIPRELYEAARIDGAGPVRQFFSITLPMLKPVLFPALVLGTIWTFNNLNVMWLVTDQGLPADKTHILVTYVYKAAFQYYRYGYAAAFSVFIFLVLVFIVKGYNRAAREEAY